MPDARAVVADDGLTIRLTTYTEAGVAVPLALSPLRAIAIANELIGAALRKIGNEARPSARSAPQRRRGGDAQAARRQGRDENLRKLAEFWHRDGEPLSAVATKIVDRQRRFQPMPEETDPERLAMLEIRNSDLPIPGVRQLLRIISSASNSE